MKQLLVGSNEGIYQMPPTRGHDLKQAVGVVCVPSQFGGCPPHGGTT